VKNKILKVHEFTVMARFQGETVLFFYDIHLIIRIGYPENVGLESIGEPVDTALINWVEEFLMGAHRPSVILDIVREDLTA
jgi:hypothetical protein